MPRPEALGLHAGEVIEVRAAAEILATLDSNGAFEALPFMPEMLQFCGKQFRVYKRADKTCDTIGNSPTPSRRMLDAVHLEGLRCNGASHGGCQARCLMFWKEAWLKRPEPADLQQGAAAQDLSPAGTTLLQSATTRANGVGTETKYVCQATELTRATTVLPWWDARQYWRELWSGNITIRTMLRAFAIATFNTVQRWRGGGEYPRIDAHSLDARSDGATPTAKLNLQPGELVRIRTKEEIFATLDKRNRNRGLYFDVEMIPFCGRAAVVEQRVDRIIDEKTGAMLNMANPCIMLAGAVCGGCLSRQRLFCPRSIYSYWREIWLERIPVEIPDRTAVGSVPSDKTEEGGAGALTASRRADANLAGLIS